MCGYVWEVDKSIVNKTSDLRKKTKDNCVNLNREGPTYKSITLINIKWEMMLTSVT